MAELEKVIRGLECWLDDDTHCPDDDCPYMKRLICDQAAILNDAISLLKAQEPITGETSDGYHTFNELYHHRAVLFSVIVANYPDRAWKSKKHCDGTMYEGMFIVGIETPDGQATYYYDIDPYWDMFKCRVLDNAPEWDGHTPAQAIERIGKLKAQEPSKYEYHTDHTDCPWYISGEESRCPVTCSQYRDGWNDAMNYIFRNGDGYQPYDRIRKGR